MKKPDFLMQTCPDGKVFDPKADLPVKTTLKVDGVFLPLLCSLNGFQKCVDSVVVCRSTCTWGMVGKRTSSRHISTHTHLQIFM